MAEFKNEVPSEVVERFEKDRFATENGAIIEEIGKNYAKCSINLTSRHKNGMGAIMGGVYFTLADFAFAVATNWENLGVVSLSSTINFLSPAKGEKLIAEAKCIKDGKATCVYEISVFDSLGTKTATVLTTGYRVHKA